MRVMVPRLVRGMPFAALTQRARAMLADAARALALPSGKKKSDQSTVEIQQKGGLILEVSLERSSGSR